MQRKRILTIVTGIVAGVLLTAGSCESQPDAQAKENERKQDTYERLVANQPAEKVVWSPTRETINFWVRTWGQEPGKLSYVYLLASNGQLVGYYIFEGLPVSYCAEQTPNYRIEGRGGNTVTRHVVPAPAMDGVYYSGNQCGVYYGKDAVSGTYMEYAVGNGITPLVYEEPLPRQDVEPLGVATVEDVTG